MGSLVAPHSNRGEKTTQANSFAPAIQLRGGFNLPAEVATDSIEPAEQMFLKENNCLRPLGQLIISQPSLRNAIDQIHFLLLLRFPEPSIEAGVDIST